MDPTSEMIKNTVKDFVPLLNSHSQFTWGFASTRSRSAKKFTCTIILKHKLKSLSLWHNESRSWAWSQRRERLHVLTLQTTNANSTQSQTSAVAALQLKMIICASMSHSVACRQGRSWAGCTTALSKISSSHAYLLLISCFFFYCRLYLNIISISFYWLFL